MRKTVFLDTNVILDFFLNREPFAEPAASILGLVVDKDVKAYVSPLTFSDCYYILRKFGSHDKVIRKLSLLLSIVSISKMTRETVIKALDSKFKDFEDALQYYSAEDYESVDVIITRNAKDYRNSSLSVMTPDGFLKSYNS
jgi:predicted nucleic acid-binding protein